MSQKIMSQGAMPQEAMPQEVVPHEAMLQAAASQEIQDGDEALPQTESFPSEIFLSKIKERICLSPLSSKKTYHLVLDLEGSQINYKVGDCLAIYPQNDPHYVGLILDKLKFAPETPIVNRKGQTVPVKNFLLNEVNLFRIPKKLGGADFLQFLPTSSFDIQTVCGHFLPMLPRYYSIASSMNVVGNEAHLTVELTENEEGASFPFGTCSYFLCCKADFETPIPLFLKPSKNFFLPEESFNKPLIMIGPGTGVAPFRGFIQERLFQKASSENWLFFGERMKSQNFYYQDLWEGLEKEGFLKLSCAFSRDAAEKIYVQHLMQKNSELFWQKLEKGAYFYVCGDAKSMAKDVDKMLHFIVETEGKMSSLEAKAYIKGLKKQNRYQRDVY